MIHAPDNDMADDSLDESAEQVGGFIDLVDDGLDIEEGERTVSRTSSSSRTLSSFSIMIDKLCDLEDLEVMQSSKQHVSLPSPCSETRLSSC